MALLAALTLSHDKWSKVTSSAYFAKFPGSRLLTQRMCTTPVEIAAPLMTLRAPRIFSASGREPTGDALAARAGSKRELWGPLGATKPIVDLYCGGYAEIWLRHAAVEI